ncbi:DUF5602 domain-containing protein [Arenibacter sp. BSSL-BM3]|uniref:DUF5602 domain-containing protein n=1 Tax=Arenibacter arenosicollis TaxID=2762274 RepID=A0ABR7QS39_9FLAO|nr:DUF5602 domain-containing protein [Arenibacter arenosicollis]MBC8770001.1 DUF5602 domain-containing protein [Arenibacter arenosicollis]
MRFKHVNYIGVGLIFLLMLLGCSPESTIDDNLEPVTGKALLKSNTFYGPQISLGKGHVRSWIRIAKDGTPEELGVEMSTKALSGLPSGPDHTSLVLPLHKKAKENTPFDHIFFNWNPDGHEPPGAFDVPHFDVHFVMVSVAEREAIPSWSPETDQLFNTYPPAGYLPEEYITPPGAGTAEPMMGKHWLPMSIFSGPGVIDPNYIFQNILLYGSYNGKVLFIEPMDTLEFLNSMASFSSDFPLPDKYEHTSYYPTTYNIFADSKHGRHYISLSNFEPRDAD